MPPAVSPLGLATAAGARISSRTGGSRKPPPLRPTATTLSALAYQEVARRRSEHLEHAPAACRSKPQNVCCCDWRRRNTLEVAARVTPRSVRAALHPAWASRPRPLRLWAEGSIFRTFTATGGGQRISERLQSGVELLGALGRQRLPS